ncbi:hypothetical protein MKX01_021416 [Papaver californicum]|nr:hypothetical protein MKX01_021416 [Papaver californicum]
MKDAVKKVPVGSFVLGIDLFLIKPIRGAISVQEDTTTAICRATIKRLMGENGVRRFDVVLHDGPPNIGGAWAQEATVQASRSLVIDAVRLVTKIFRPQDYDKVLYCLKQRITIRRPRY